MCCGITHTQDISWNYSQNKQNMTNIPYAWKITPEDPFGLKFCKQMSVNRGLSRFWMCSIFVLRSLWRLSEAFLLSVGIRLARVFFFCLSAAAGQLPFHSGPPALRRSREIKGRRRLEIGVSAQGQQVNSSRPPWRSWRRLPHCRVRLEGGREGGKEGGRERGR